MNVFLATELLKTFFVFPNWFYLLILAGTRLFFVLNLRSLVVRTELHDVSRTIWCDKSVPTLPADMLSSLASVVYHSKHLNMAHSLAYVSYCGSWQCNISVFSNAWKAGCEQQWIPYYSGQYPYYTNETSRLPQPDRSSALILWSTCKHFFTSSLIIMQNLVVVSHDTVYVEGPENTGQFIIFWCQISSDCRIPKFIEVGWFFTELFEK